MNLFLDWCWQAPSSACTPGHYGQTHVRSYFSTPWLTQDIQEGTQMMFNDFEVLWEARLLYQLGSHNNGTRLLAFWLLFGAPLGTRFVAGYAQVSFKRLVQWKVSLLYKFHSIGTAHGMNGRSVHIHIGFEVGYKSNVENYYSNISPIWFTIDNFTFFYNFE